MAKSCERVTLTNANLTSGLEQQVAFPKCRLPFLGTNQGRTGKGGLWSLLHNAELGVGAE